jgi:hypothetical protein
MRSWRCKKVEERREKAKNGVTVKKTAPFVIAGAAIAGIGAVAGCAACLSASRQKTIASIKKLFDYADGYNLYSMNICYDYDLDAVIARGVGDDQSMVDSFVKEALPLIPVHIELPRCKRLLICFRVTTCLPHAGAITTSTLPMPQVTGVLWSTIAIRRRVS